MPFRREQHQNKIATAKQCRQIKELFLAKKVNLESLENIMQGRPKFKSDETSPSPDLKHFKTKLQMFYNAILL